MRIGNREFDLNGHTYIMGILNVTPDSFSDGGKWQDKDLILRRVEEMLSQGMDILDIGGESTRPGYLPVPAEEEIERVVPIIEAVKGNFDIPVSLDTCKAAVARAGAKAGADMINDIWGLQYDGEMAGVIGKAQLPCCLMHNRKEAVYGNFLEEVKEDMKVIQALAGKAGIGEDKILLDPGVGFAKNQDQNLEILRNLDFFMDLGVPLLLGCSRKSVIGNVLELPVDQRLEGTLATTFWAVMKGCAFVRVHDIVENARVIRMAEALMGR